MKTRNHMCIDIFGAIKNPKQWLDCITVDGKVLETVTEIKQFFKERLAEGYNFLPCGDCEGFDFVTGKCPGHVIEEESE